MIAKVLAALRWFTQCGEMWGTWRCPLPRFHRGAHRLPTGVPDAYGEPYGWGETPLEEQCREAFERAYNATDRWEN
jgi:hypothetical protein